GWRSWCWRRLLRGRRTIDRIGHQADINAAVLSSTITGLVRLNWLVLAQTNQIDLVGRDAVLRCQVLNHGISATLAESVVVICIACRVSAALDGNNVALCIGYIRCQLVQRFLASLGQVVLVETKLHRGLGDHAI